MTHSRIGSQSESVLIRPATGGDLGAVAAIFAHYVTTSVVTFEVTPYTVEDWAFATPWRPKPAYRHTVEDAIYLAPGQTGRGLGRRLLTALQHETARAGAEQMIAVIADSGDPASAALHRACGFTEAGRLRKVGRKFGRVIDTVLFQYDLTAAR